MLIGDELIRRRVWTNDDSGENVTEHHRLLELPEEHGDDSRHHHHDGEVLEKGDVFHDCSIRVEGWVGRCAEPELRCRQVRARTPHGETTSNDAGHESHYENAQADLSRR